jgi:uncharacterized membrane protein
MRRLGPLLWTIVIFLSLIGVAVAVRRMAQLERPSPAPSRFPDAVAMEAGFTRHSALTVAHIAPALLFLLLAPLQFLPALRRKRAGVHRWIGRVATGAGLAMGGIALVMSQQMAIGGKLESAATTFYGGLFLYALVRGYRSIRQGNVRRHREWMIRAYAVGLGAAAVRPVMGLFFATIRITHLTPRQFFGIAFWLGFTLTWIAAEGWIRYTGALRVPGTGLEARPHGAL